jgi:hypothetical protein
LFQLSRPGAFALLLFAFAGRLAYGLASPFWYEDERQVYLIGLRSYARSEWPWFGTEVAVDVVGRGQQLPGALQGWLVRLPLELWPVPEAPFLFLNILSFAALALLAWYCGRRQPSVPRPLIWGAALTLPWTLNFSTHIVNTSFVLPGAVMFFVGFLEAAPTFRAGLLPRTLAWSLMGAGVLWVMQVHLSWVLLPPYVLLAAIDLARREWRAMPRASLALGAGAAAVGVLLLPTVREFGWSSAGGGSVVGLYPAHLAEAVNVLARFLSFPSFETNRFLGLTTAERVMFLWRQPWVVPFVVFVTLAGFVQPVLMLIGWFRFGHGDRTWRAIRLLLASSMAWVILAFLFSARRPLAHTYYVMFPVAFVYAVFWWSRSATRRWNRIAAAVLVSGVLTHAGLALDRMPRLSLYVDRPLVQAAIATPNDRYLGDRRDSLQTTQDRTPRHIDQLDDPDAWLRANPAEDLEVVSSEWSPVSPGNVSRFAVAIRNRSDAAAYLDLQFVTRYRNADGALIDERQGIIKEILQPGATKRWRDVTDGSPPDGAVRAEIAIVSAEKVIPTADRG